MTLEADVVVIGGGGAGLAAASAAARLGRKVVLLEKEATLGGTTAWSVGSISATGTPHQRRAGIKDSPDAHFEDLALFAGTQVNRDNLALRRILVDNIADTFDWLESTGLVFSGPSLEPPHRVPRMHNVLPNSRAFPHHLGRHCRRLGVDIRLSMAAIDLVNECGRVTGVVARSSDGASQTFTARSGVVLASGDYSGNAEMKRQYAGPQAARTPSVNPHSTGDGQRLGLAQGGRIVNGDIVSGPRLRFVPPPRGSLADRLPPYGIVGKAGKLAIDHAPARLLRPFLMSFVTTALGVEADLYKNGAILVNKNGERFVDELAMPAERVAEQPDGLAYVVLDSALAKKFSGWPHFVSTAPGVAYAYMADYRRNRRDIFHEATSIPELAGKSGSQRIGYKRRWRRAPRRRAPRAGRPWPELPTSHSAPSRPTWSSPTAVWPSRSGSKSPARRDSPFPDSMRRGRLAKAAFCSMVTGTIWDGHSSRAVSLAGTRPWRNRRDRANFDKVQTERGQTP